MHMIMPPQEDRAIGIITLTCTENLVKFGRVVLEICKQFVKFMAIKAVIQTIFEY